MNTYSSQERVVVQEIARENLIALGADVEGRSDIGERSQANGISDDRNAILKIPEQLSISHPQK